MFKERIIAANYGKPIPPLPLFLSFFILSLIDPVLKPIYKNSSESVSTILFQLYIILGINKKG